MSRSTFTILGYIALALVLVTTRPASARAADLKEAVEQLASQLAQAVPQDRVIRVAVTDFPDLQGVTSDLGRYIAERLTTRLSGQAQRFRVIERRRLNLVLTELRFSLSDLVDPNKAKQLGKMLGVEGLVVGSVSDLGNQVDIDARIIEIETNNIFPGVTTAVTKDQVVTQLLSQGREQIPSVAPASGPLTSGVSTSAIAAAPHRAGTHPFNLVFSGIYPSTIKLFNAEFVDGKLLRLNLSVENSGGGPATLEVFLDNPRETAFLLDQLAVRGESFAAHHAIAKTE